MESGQNFQRLPELHALACGLKALVTQEVAEAIDVLRRACGGHGFMASSNLPRLWGLVTAACTYEGENTVLQLQVNHFSFHNSQCLKITKNVSFRLQSSLKILKKVSFHNIVSFWKSKQTADFGITNVNKQLTLVL